MGMPSIDACINTIIAILGVAYPILLEVISRLDDKYSSAGAVELFENELEKKYFVMVLVASTVAAALWFLQLPPILEFATNSALSIVYFFTILLVFLFFLLTRKVLIYYNTQKFTLYLQKRHKNNRNDSSYFEILTDVFVAAISARNSPIVNEIANFIHTEFELQRTHNQDKAVAYPAAYYTLVSRAAEELAILGNRKNKGLVRLTAGGGLLLGGGTHHIISEETYSVIWHTLKTSLDYGQDDMIYEYWKTASYYIDNQLKPIDKVYGDSNFNVTNIKEVDARKEERARFIEFHHALGAMVLYSGKSELLRKLFSYTSSSPPQYALLPSSMDEVFSAFVQYDGYYSSGMPVDLKYPFPGEAGVGSEGLIKKWLCTYMATLFLRQYSLETYYIYERPREQPVPPADQPSKKSWLNSLEYFKKLVTDMLQNSRLLQDLQLDFISRDWCADKHLDYPLNFIDNSKVNIERAYRRDADFLPLSAEKVQEFKSASGRVIERTIDDMLLIANNDEIGHFKEAEHIKGAARLVSKDYYAEKSESTYLNSETDFVYSLKKYLLSNVLYLFSSNFTAIYNLREEDVFSCLSRLGIDSQYVIINLGLNLIRIAADNNTTELLPDVFRGANILDYRAPHDSKSLIVIRKADLPRIQFFPPSAAEIDKYDLTRISDRYGVYATVLDANQVSPEVESELKDQDFGIFNDELGRNQALEMIQCEIHVSWRKSVKLAHILVHRSNSGFTSYDNIDSVIPL